MAKLSIILTGKFKTTGFEYHNHETGAIEMMSKKSISDLFSTLDPNELGLMVVGFDGDSTAGFAYKKTDQKKQGTLFNVSLNADATGLDVELAGEWSVKLRSGADNYARESEFYLEGITYKGGSWSGFISIIEGLDNNHQQVPELDEKGNPVIVQFGNKTITPMRTVYNFDTWPRITEVTVK
jgi:hypothetical protein